MHRTLLWRSAVETELVGSVSSIECSICISLSNGLLHIVIELFRSFCDLFKVLFVQYRGHRLGDRDFLAKTLGFFMSFK